MSSEYITLLVSYIRKHFVHINYGEFDGMNDDPSLDELITLQSILKLAITTYTRDNIK